MRTEMQSAYKVISHNINYLNYSKILLLMLHMILLRFEYIKIGSFNPMPNIVDFYF